MCGNDAFHRAYQGHRSHALSDCTHRLAPIPILYFTSMQYLATADDDGMVKLFNYPCVVDDAPHRAYRGHCSHVMGVRFNKDDSLVRVAVYLFLGGGVMPRTRSFQRP